MRVRSKLSPCALMLMVCFFVCASVPNGAAQSDAPDTDIVASDALESETVPYIDFAEARAAAAGTFMGTYRLDQQERACELWVRGDIPEGFFDMPPLETPILLLSGELDPTVRPATVAVLAASLPNSLHYIVPNCGHNLGPAFEMGLDVEMAKFMTQANFEGLDFSGPDGTQRPPFVSWRGYVGKSMKFFKID